MNLTPLAVYTNSIASMFNELRHCAPVSIWLNVVQALQASLKTVINLTVEILRCVSSLVYHMSSPLLKFIWNFVAF